MVTPRPIAVACPTPAVTIAPGLLSRDVRRAVGLDRVLPTDASASPARPALDEPNYSRDRPSGRPRCQDDASHRNWETPVDTEPPRGRDRSQFGDSPATSGSNAALANLSSGNAAADPVAPWRKAAAGVPVFSSLGSFSTNTSNQRQSHQESGEDRGTGPEVAASFEETGRGATTCVFAFYKRLVVGISWLAAPADVRAAYLSQFVGLADLKLYFCPYANQSSEASPTSWTDLWLLLRNNEKSLERLSLVSLPYEAKLFMKPRRSAHAEPDQPPASVPSQHNTPSMSTQLRRVARGASRQSVSAMGRDLGESSAHTFVDEMFRRETRRAPGTRGSLHPGTLYQGEGGSTQAVSGCFPHRPGTTVYLQALREFSIVGSATSCLVTLDAVQPLLPHSLESFSLHGNLPRTLPGPLFGTEEGDRIRSSRAGPGGTGALASRAFQGFGLPGSVRRFFGWEGSENVDLDESDEGKEDEAQVVLSSLEGVGDDATWQLEVSREVLLRSVMMMHNLTVLDIRLPPALDRFSFRLVPSLVLMCTRLRQVTLDFRQLAELVDVSVLTASVVTEPFGVTPLSPSYRLRSDPEAAEARGSSGAGETPAWGGVQTLLPNLTEVVLREPLHVGWAVEDVARLMGVLLALPQCRIIASALVLHQHPLLGAFRPLPQAVTERRQNASCRGGTDLPSTDRALTSQEGRELSGPPREREDVELDMSAVGDPSRRSTESSGDGESESAQETEEALRREIDDPDDSAEGSGRLHLEAEWEEGETGDGLIVGRAQYVALLRQVIEHLAPNVCSLRVRYTSASTCDLPLSMISFPLLQELVLDNYCPDAHLEIDKIVVPRTHTVTVGLNGYHVDPTRLYKFDRFNGEYWQHGSVDASPSQKSYLRLFRALEPVSYYFKGPEDVLFLLSLNEDVAAEIRNSPPPVSDDIWTATTTSPANNVPVCTEPVADCPGRLSLSVTVSGRDLRDSAKAILAEAERCMKEQEEREEGSEDALGGNSCKRRLNFVGLIIVDLDMHASTTGASAEVIAAAMRLTDERFGKRLRKSEGCGVRTSMSSTVQEGPTGLRRPLHPACNASTAAGETERAGPYSTELPSRGLHVPAVENRLNNCSIPGVSAGTTQIRYSRQHPLYLLDDQTLHVALAPSSRFLVTRCGFTEARDDGAPGASDAFGSSGRRLTKLGFACERVKLSELGR
ncbi:conserved hypothetical protein [Neospora caninum Liverpool]|uniref:Uncharacterized protein n=1 Tax=Neospora caninum (strain Liverpool) TaxID=572307 RepID=F0VFA5_NEOCL|nr:conserved hypothetical protein [Neospora caninum Liverpool]CBZ52399.1 conserved hypothetical protein [Neospora caninum Liverpool]|eukprot:XP_003882431.1 conserved hypothetical protein [Neospora caninum Liverpool]